jgi:EAL domain-containing protein (putative c-di-GMP-specific phosphodiesterase class I)
MEVLLRWRGGGRADTPDQFIPIIEENGMIVPIGEWVITPGLQAKHAGARPACCRCRWR